MKPTDPIENISRSDNDAVQENQTAVPNLENAAISRLSRVVDMSSINGRSHTRPAAQNKNNKNNKNSQNKKNQRNARESAPKEPACEKTKDGKNDRNRELVKINRNRENAKVDRVREMPKIDPMVDPQKTLMKRQAQESPTYAARRAFAIVPEIAASRAEYEAKTTRLLAPTPDALSKQEKQNAAVPVPDTYHAKACIAPVVTPSVPAEHTKAEQKPKTTVRLAGKKNNKRERAGLRPNKLRKIAQKKALFESQKAAPVPVADDKSEMIEDALLLQSWRARKWCEAVTAVSPAFRNKIPDAMPLVQAGLVNNICITPGLIEATIFDQVVSISMRQFTAGQWEKVIHELANRAIFTTSLLNGELPEGILDIFKQAASLSLFPSKIREFNFTCDCEPEHAPCEHACALLIAFAQLLEDDPFHILTLRGMTRDNLLNQLREARSDQVVDEKTRFRVNYELPAQNVNFSDFYSPRDDFGNLNFHITYISSSLIRRLNDPAPWDAPFSVSHVLQPVIDAASREAEQLGQCEHFELSPDENADQTDDIDEEDIQPQQPLSRAPRNSSAGRGDIPDMRFIENCLTPEILAEITDDPISAAEDIYRWLLTRGASDIRTLARRTRLHKTTIETFLGAFCDAGLTVAEGDGEKMRFSVSATSDFSR